MLTKQDMSLGRGPRREQRGEAPGGRLWLRARGARVYGEGDSLSGLSVGDHSDPGSLLGALLNKLSQHRFQQGGFWELVGYGVPPSDFSQILPVGD